MGFSDRFKQVIVIRTDIKMSTGKKCAQSCHASLSSADQAKIMNMRIYKDWRNLSGQRKIVLKIQSQEAIETLYHKIKADGIPCYLVSDAGLTQLEPGTITALGIGPDVAQKIDKHCKHLKLL